MKKHSRKINPLILARWIAAMKAKKS